MASITNVDPTHAPRYVPEAGGWVDHGKSVEVPEDAAGRPPKGEDPGSGYLAQTEVWAPKADKPAKAEKGDA